MSSRLGGAEAGMGGGKETPVEAVDTLPSPPSLLGRVEAPISKESSTFEDDNLTLESRDKDDFNFKGKLYEDDLDGSPRRLNTSESFGMRTQEREKNGFLQVRHRRCPSWMRASRQVVQEVWPQIRVLGHLSSLL